MMQVPFESHGPPAHFGSLWLFAVHFWLGSSIRSSGGQVIRRSLVQVPVWHTEVVVLQTIPAPAWLGSFAVPRSAVENLGIVAPLVALELGPTSLKNPDSLPAGATMTACGTCDWPLKYCAFAFHPGVSVGISACTSSETLNPLTRLTS